MAIFFDAKMLRITLLIECSSLKELVTDILGLRPNYYLIEGVDGKLKDRKAFNSSWEDDLIIKTSARDFFCIQVTWNENSLKSLKSLGFISK